MGRINPLISLAGNLLLEAVFGKQDASSKGDVPELADIPCIAGLRHKQGAVLLFIGARETGNTTEMLRVAEIIGRPTYGVFPEQKPPPWVTEVDFQDLDRYPPPFSTLILDDLAVKMSNRSYYDPYVQVVEKIIPVCRHRRKLILMFRAQTSKQVDRCVEDADIVSCKPLGPLFGDTERPAVLRLYKEVTPLFAGMSDYQEKCHCYIVHRRWHGLARIDLPSMQ